jgi:hypothetical protein
MFYNQKRSTSGSEKEKKMKKKRQENSREKHFNLFDYDENAERVFS